MQATKTEANGVESGHECGLWFCGKKLDGWNCEYLSKASNLVQGYKGYVP